MMVPAYLSRLDGVVPRGAAALSSAAQDLPGVWTPTDHLSLLWCNQLVRVLAKAIVAAAALRAEPSDASPALEERVGALQAALLGTAAGSSADASGGSALASDSAFRPTDHASSVCCCALHPDPYLFLLDATSAALLLGVGYVLLDAWRSRGGGGQGIWRLLFSAVCGAAFGVAVHTIDSLLTDALLAVHADSPNGASLAASSSWLEPSPPCEGAGWLPALNSLARLGLARGCFVLLVCAVLFTSRPASLRVRPRHASSQSAEATASWRYVIAMATAIPLALLTHPAVGLATAALAPLFGTAKGGATAFWSVHVGCAAAALAPGAAVWLRRGGLTAGSALSYSADAQWAACHVALIVMAQLIASCHQVARVRCALARLAAVAAGVLCAYATSSRCHSEAILRLVTLHALSGALLPLLFREP